MTHVTSAPLPVNALLYTYATQDGSYTDCFHAQVPNDVNLREFIATFFNTPVFRLERFLIATFGRKPSNVDDVNALAAGTLDSFALWQVESRDDDQILLKVGNSPIRTWLMCSSVAGQTQLSFGSALLPTRTDKQGRPKMDGFSRALLGFHKLYSRILLWSAARRLA